MQLWSSEQAWTAGGTNLYRNKDTSYFLPSENEWYKAAYYNAAGTNYFLYPTASSSAPTRVVSGTNAGTAVYGPGASPATVPLSGVLSPYGTMGQGGNVWEWNESAYDGINSSSTESRVYRGGSFVDGVGTLGSSVRFGLDPAIDYTTYGFRVASVGVTPVPEPSTYFAALGLLCLGALPWLRRKRAKAF
jgi:MYXO-CTERM domain-containing protein